MTTNVTLYKQIKEQMKTEQVSKKLASWLKQAQQTQCFIDAHRNTFNEWVPLKFYITLGCKSVFSIRYKGQEVATLSCSSKDVGGPTVKISKKQITSNKKFLQYKRESRDFKWRSSEGTKFRKHFRDNDFKGHSPEHGIECGLIAGLIDSKKPPKSTLRNRTAVTLGGFPLQFPVPFSACTGTIKTTTGHVDILGRKHPGVLSVWELKSPSVWRGAARQAYIYSLQIYSMINDPNIGKEWLKLFGITRESKAIKIEIVVGVSEKYTEQVKKEIIGLKEEMKADGIEGLFSWNIASYNDDLNPGKIAIHEIS
jgi:hypothetical protein